MAGKSFSNRLGIAIAVAALCFPVGGAVADDTPALCGDVNANGNVTSSDALQVLKKSVGQPVALTCLDFIDRYGTPADLNVSSYNSPNYLLGRPVTIARAATVVALGMISRDEEAGGFRLALYKDSGGEPGDLVVATEPGKVRVGSQEVAVTPTAVPAGNYWLMGIFEVETRIAGNGEAPDTPENTVKFRALNWGSPLPSPFGAALTYGEAHLQYWVKVTQ